MTDVRRAPMTATQKLLAYHAGRPAVTVGDWVQVPVNYWLASELALKGMLKTHRELGEPHLVAADRFILALDHTTGTFTPFTPRPLH